MRSSPSENSFQIRVPVGKRQSFMSLVSICESSGSRIQRRLFDPSLQSAN